MDNLIFDYFCKSGMLPVILDRFSRLNFVKRTLDAPLEHIVQQLEVGDIFTQF